MGTDNESTLRVYCTSFRILPPETRFTHLNAKPSLKGGHEAKQNARILTDCLTPCIVQNKHPIQKKQILLS